ncbi:MAG: NADH-quinone oxidoreductase subunit NuoH [Planctomycetota bacterium]
MTLTEIYLMGGKLIGFFGLVVTLAALLTLAERKVSAWIQQRYGPNRVGPWGLLQPLADGVKFIFKEEVVPAGANQVLFRLAPAMTAGPALLAVAVVPFTFPVVLDGKSYAMSIADVPIAVLVILALGSLQVYGVLFGGWASNNKYSLLGGLRSSAQMVSYELALVLSVLAVVTLTGTLNLTEVFYKDGAVQPWNLLRFPVGTIAFGVFLIAAFAETNRHPFDLAEAETELVGGFHTEYSSMKFALFFIGEYAAMVTMSCLLAILFLGGPTLFGLLAGIEDTWLRALLGFVVFMAKAGFFMFLFIWVRWTIPRFRWDQLMHMGWKVLLPISLLNVALAGVQVVLGTGNGGA